MKKTYALCILILFSLNGFSQPSIQWQKCFGGSGHDWGVNTVQQTFDRGYILAGTSYSDDGNVTGHHGSVSYRDYWIVKLDSNGTLQWQTSLGGTLDDIANAVRQTSDSGYIVAGFTASNDGDVTNSYGFGDYWIVKLDHSGQIQWQKAFGGSNSDQATSVNQTNDGGYILGGHTRSTDGDVSGNHGNYDCFILKLDGNGNTQWKKCLGGSWAETLYSIQQTGDGGYIISGNASSFDGDVTGVHGKWDYWIVKIDSGGDIQWQKTFGGSEDDSGYSVYPCSDGGYIIGGSTNSIDGDVTDNHGPASGYWDSWIIKIDGSGNIQWKKCYGGNSHDYTTCIQQTLSGEIIAAGYTMSVDGDVTGNHGGYDMWVIKLDINGSILWKQCLGGTSFEYANSLKQTEDGGYIIAGDSYSNDGDVTGNHGGWDYWIVKLYPDEPTAISNEPNDMRALTISPNPAANQLIIDGGELKIEEIEIYNTLGEKIYSQQPQTTSDKPQTVDVSQLPSGIYFVRVRNEKKGESAAKFVKE